MYVAEYPAIALEEARSVLDMHWRGIPLEKLEPRRRGRGAPYDETRVENLRDELHDLRQQVGQPSNSRSFWARFEGLAAGVTHRVLELPASVAADPGFWAWIVLGRGDQFFLDLIDWRFRFSDGAKRPDSSNYSTSPDLEAGFLSRLWLRGDIGYDPSRENPYELVLRGDQDLWRSHIMRQEYGHVRLVAQALVRFQYPDEHPERKAVSISTIREMAKEIRRRHATLAFELLAPEDADDLVRSVHDTILQAGVSNHS